MRVSFEGGEALRRAAREWREGSVVVGVSEDGGGVRG